MERRNSQGRRLDGSIPVHDKFLQAVEDSNKATSGIKANVNNVSQIINSLRTQLHNDECKKGWWK